MEKELLAAIEEKRIELIEYGLQHGLSSEVSLQRSQELDKLLNLYANFQKNKKDKAKVR
ncbi:aspartyl-phosphate phosphatase Spo0E family protein [Bacillus alkalicellulosilyticus]|uniref:aspartyl-phosphate phosphatase Spo0E family protein n=1 Tax=Alkalihalobacterium alkalicellulosilyticum TaxID=1912214 RepID=UPI000996B556|nr:aspartyl-phosphate phosphatase Spo0E family protein [Bacillus alkalicellulosilyticus]